MPEFRAPANWTAAPITDAQAESLFGIELSRKKGEAKDRFKYSVARLNIMASYTRPLNENSSIAVYGGISGGYIFKNITNRFYVRKKDFVGGVTIEESDIFKPVEYARRVEQGFLLGAKYKIGKLGLDFRFAKTNGWEARPLFHTFVSTFSLISSYAF